MDRKLMVTLAILCLVEYISSTSVICYHGTWSHYRTGNGKFSVSDVPANLCTHYIYSFVGMSSTSYEVVTLDSWLDISLGGFSDAVALKNVNPNLKVLLAVGGWNEGSAKYSLMAASATTRATFIQSALKWVQTYNFDGFDIDWEYPGKRDSTNSEDKANFALLLQEMSTVFKANGLLLTAAVSAVPSSLDISYDVPVLSQYLDFINVMLYDFHGAWDSTANHNAPLYSCSRLAGTEYADYSVNASIQGWISRGASPSKLAMGVPFYGRTVILSSSSNTSPGAATTSTGGAAGPYTATSGFWGYNEIVEQFNAGGWTQVWDDEQKVPYAYSGTTWLSYENEASLALKVAYAKSQGLGAIMIWAVETEDFKGACGTQYPLLTTIQNALGSSSDDESTASSTSSSTTTTTEQSATSTASTTTTTTTTASTTTGSSSDSSDSSSIANATSCTSAGYFRCSSDCSTYYYCREVNGAYVGVQLSCPTGLYYDSSSNACNYASLVSC